MILDPDLNFITKDGRDAVSRDKNGDAFPWPEKLVNPASEVRDSFKDGEGVVLVHFTGRVRYTYIWKRILS